MIPDGYYDLLGAPYYGVLTTIMPTGQPQSTVVWCDFDGQHVLINTMRHFQKAKNMRANPHITLFVFDRSSPLRSIEVRGMVINFTETGALEHLDHLSLAYTGAAPYFGACVPAEFKATEIPMLFNILPTHVVAEAVEHDPLAKPFKSPRPPSVNTIIPDSHLDLLVQPIHAVLTTMLPNGQPQSSLVWCDYDGYSVRVNTTRERQKGKNMQANPKVTLLVIDPHDTSRWIEIRGEVTLTEQNTLTHLDDLTQCYTIHQHYYGELMPAERQATETRIICQIKPTKITLDAIHR